MTIYDEARDLECAKRWKPPELPPLKHEPFRPERLAELRADGRAWTEDDWRAEERYHDRLVAARELGVRVTRLSDVDREHVSWLWPGRIPLGKLTMLDGDPNLGKSTVALDLAARVTTGTPFPGEPDRREPASVVLLTAEDGLGDTVGPRLDAAGGDAKRVVVIESIIDTNDGGEIVERPPSLPDDIVRLERTVSREGAALVVVDVLNAFLAARVDSYRDQDIRRALMPLANMAARTGAAVVALRHLTKGRSGNALYAGGGSIGIVGAARAALLVAADPDDEAESRRILAVTKCNLSKPVPAVAFRLVPSDEHGCARVRWEGTTGHQADDLVSIDTREERSAIAEAAEFLRDFLADGDRPQREIKTEAERACLAWHTVRRAKDRLGVRSRKVGAPGERGEWRWTLRLNPEDAHPTPKMPLPEGMGTFASDGHLRDLADDDLGALCSAEDLDGIAVQAAHDRARDAAAEAFE
jgi:hypothetical protein